PHDIVHYKPFGGIVNRGQERDVNIEPIPDYIPNMEEYRGNLKVTPLDKDNKPTKPTNESPRGLRSIEPYERLVVDKVKDFLAKGYDKLPTVARDYLTRREQLVAAEQALAWAVRFHESAKQLGQRKGEAWEPLDSELRQLLLGVRIDQLNDL